jgi:hypothetical protein
MGLIKDRNKNKIVFFVISALLLTSTVTLGIFYGYERKRTWDRRIDGLPPIDQMMLYYEFCRAITPHKTQNERLEFYVNLILHASKQYNAFTEVDEIFANNNWEFVTGNSMEEVWYCVNQYFNHMSRWNGTHELHEVFSTACKIDYRFDNDTLGIIGNNIDYIQSPLEIIYRDGGDCEDLAIFGATLFENNGYNTLIANIHDDNYPYSEEETNGLHHSFFFVEMDSYADKFWYFEGDTRYWFLFDIDWMRYDIGSTPSWLNKYPNRTLCFNYWSDIMYWKEVKLNS